jgi:hypothetical protein
MYVRISGDRLFADRLFADRLIADKWLIADKKLRTWLFADMAHCGQMAYCGQN